MSLDRARVWELLGPPDEQVGSVNDPRTQELLGVAWNEKWIYLAADGQRPQRIVLWHRYDFVGAFRCDGEGDLEPFALPKPP